jgi:hypothetical protein
MRKDIGVISLLLRDYRKSSIGGKCTRTRGVTPVRSVTKGRNLLDKCPLEVTATNQVLGIDTYSG